MATHLILTGMPGSGKTSVGKLLAERLKIEFYDLDSLIENAKGKSVQQIFEEEGEVAFRIDEKNTLDSFLETHLQEDYVLALGGGTVCYHNNLEAIKKNGLLFFLDCALNELEKRLKHQQETRPLFKSVPHHAFSGFLKEMMEKRKKFYYQSHHQIDTSGSEEQILQKITKAIHS